MEVKDVDLIANKIRDVILSHAPKVFSDEELVEAEDNVAASYGYKIANRGRDVEGRRFITIESVR